MPDNMPGDPRKPYNRRLEALRLERNSWDSHWAEVAMFIKSRSGRFLTSDRNKGNKRNGRIIDGTGRKAARTLASGMMSGVTSPARPWFKLATPNKELMNLGSVRLWLSDVEELLREIFARSNTYDSLHQVYSELGVFGVGSMTVLEDYEDVIRCQVHTIGSYFLATDHKDQVDTIYLERDFTVGQLAKDYGEDALSPNTRKLYTDGKLDAWITVVNAIEANPNYREGNPLAKYKPFISVHYEKKGDAHKFLRESGYDEFPNMSPRWSIIAGDVYSGENPGMDALGDIKQLQSEQRSKGQGVQRMVDPPMVGPSSLRGQGASTLPGALTFIDTTQGSQGFTPVYQINPQLTALTEDIREIQNAIREDFYADLFLMLANDYRNQRATAREIDERHEEKLLALGPVLERLNGDLLDPLIDRTFNIAMRAGIVPEAPPELQGVDLKVEYISILAQAQRSVGTISIERALGFVSNLAVQQAAAGSAPDALDKVDMDQAIDEYTLMTGVPPSIIRSDKDVAGIREQRAQAQQRQRQLAMAQQGAETAKTASEVDTGDGNNALSDIMKRVSAGQ